MMFCIFQERRKALEAERMARLQEMQERRKKKETDIENMQLLKEKERIETAKAKERDREERIAALNAQQQAHIEELQKKIQLKVWISANLMRIMIVISISTTTATIKCTSFP